MKFTSLLFAFFAISAAIFCEPLLLASEKNQEPTKCAAYQAVLDKLIGQSVWFNPAGWDMSCIFMPESAEGKESEWLEAEDENAKPDIPAAWEKLKIADARIIECKDTSLGIHFKVSNSTRKWIVRASITTLSDPDKITIESLLYGGRTFQQAVNCLLPWDPKVKYAKTDFSPNKVGKFHVGMSEAAAQLSVGKPGLINQTGVGNKIYEQWVYARDQLYLYFDKGRMTSFQN